MPAAAPVRTRPVLLAVALFMIGGLPLFLWGFCVSTVMLWHGTFFINSLAHVYGSVRYRTPDQSRNNWWLALLTLGEGWHNNHHHFQSSANQGFFWWEVDGSYCVLRLLHRFHLVWDLRTPPAHVLDDRPGRRRAPAVSRGWRHGHDPCVRGPTEG